jgi:transposase InsO family protein
MHLDERHASAVRFLRQTVACFERLGVRTRRVLADNGSAFRSRALAKACRRFGIKHSFTRPYRTQTNGKAKRFIQSAVCEWAYGIAYQHSSERTTVVELDSPLQLASTAPTHRRRNTDQSPGSRQQQPLDAPQPARGRSGGLRAARLPRCSATS